MDYPFRLSWGRDPCGAFACQSSANARACHDKCPCSGQALSPASRAAAWIGTSAAEAVLHVVQNTVLNLQWRLAPKTAEMAADMWLRGPGQLKSAGAGSPERHGQQLCNWRTLFQAAHTSVRSCRCRTNLLAGSSRSFTAAGAAKVQPQHRHLPCSGLPCDCVSWCRRSRALPQAALTFAVPPTGHRK